MQSLNLDPEQSYLCHQCKVGECVEVFVEDTRITHVNEYGDKPFGESNGIRYVVKHPFGQVGGVVSVLEQWKCSQAEDGGSCIVYSDGEARDVKTGQVVTQKKSTRDWNAFKRAREMPDWAVRTNMKLTSEPTVTERDGRLGWVGILERLEG